MKLHNGRYEKKPPKLPPSEDDVWLAELHTACARAAARWLKAAVNIDRPIKSLTLVELKGLAGAVEGEWLKKVAARLAGPVPAMTEEEKASYARLLIGA